MPHLGKKAREQRLHRAAEIFGLVRNALPRETWNDERCGAVAAKLWCLGYLSVEDLRSYLFANNLLTEPEKILLAELANPQHDAVTTYSLPKGFEQYLSYPCPCRPVDFLRFIAYARDVYEEEPEKAAGGAGAAIPIVSPTGATVLAAEREAGAGADTACDTTNSSTNTGKRARDDARFVERYNYTRRSLRKVAEELCWSGKDDFFKVVNSD